MIAQLRLKYARSLELISSLETEHSQAQIVLEHENETKSKTIDILTEEVNKLRTDLSKTLSELEEIKKTVGVSQLTLNKSQVENNELLLTMKQLENSLLEMTTKYEQNKSNQFDIDTELLNQRNKLKEQNNEIINLKNENLKLLTHSIHNDEMDKMKQNNVNLTNQLEESQIQLEDIMRQLAVERRARVEAENLRNETGERLALCGSRLRNLSVNHEELQLAFDSANEKHRELNSTLVSERATAYENEKILSNRITELENDIAELGGGSKFKKFVALKHEKKSLEDELSTLKGTVNLVDKLGVGGSSGGGLLTRARKLQQPPAQPLKSSNERKPLEQTKGFLSSSSSKPKEEVGGENDSWPPLAPYTTNHVNLKGSLPSSFPSSNQSNMYLQHQQERRRSRERSREWSGKTVSASSTPPDTIEAVRSSSSLQWRQQHQLEMEQQVQRRGGGGDAVRDRIRAAF